jgi:hypothetical protein
MNDFLYGVSYVPEPVCCPKVDCGNTNLYELTATSHYLCIECGYQFPIEEPVK